ncbi:carboxymuconolactone decarboxylase family protein [Bacillus sp. JJ722]|uniref:carboxymuconolactone decarboxylase family protein n=1 Tax=Bacillus sp. JJ722 TaxID=3122973 RepID=UPI0030009365
MKDKLKRSFKIANKFLYENLAQLKELAPEQLKAFNDFNVAVFKEGALTVKEKEIVAVAIAHITQCPYCIESHTKKLGATSEELAEELLWLLPHYAQVVPMHTWLI